jgi:hypothetical protein
VILASEKTFSANGGMKEEWSELDVEALVLLFSGNKATRRTARQNKQLSSHDNIHLKFAPRTTLKYDAESCSLCASVSNPLFAGFQCFLLQDYAPLARVLPQPCSEPCWRNAENEETNNQHQNLARKTINQVVLSIALGSDG